MGLKADGRHRRYCPKGHDTAICGRVNRRCRVCRGAYEVTRLAGRKAQRAGRKAMPGWGRSSNAQGREDALVELAEDWIETGPCTGRMLPLFRRVKSLLAKKAPAGEVCFAMLDFAEAYLPGPFLEAYGELEVIYHDAGTWADLLAEVASMYAGRWVGTPKQYEAFLEKHGPLPARSIELGQLPPYWPRMETKGVAAHG